MQIGKRRGFIGLVYSLFGLFIVAIMAMALAVPFAQQQGIASADGNIAAAPGAKAILGVSTTVFVGIIAVMLLGGMAAFAYVKR